MLHKRLLETLSYGNQRLFEAVIKQIFTYPMQELQSNVSSPTESTDLIYRPLKNPISVEGQ
jgi:hypothetical protein